MNALAERIEAEDCCPILLVSGETSGDLHSAKLVEKVLRQLPSARFFGMGGSALRQAGMETVVDSEHSASVMGVSEVFGSLFKIRQAFIDILAEVDRRKPRLAILVDFPDFNLLLARFLKKRGVRVFYFISPQLWAWRQGRVKTMRRFVDFVAPIFPFEASFYKKHGVAAEFIGHPFLDRSPLVLKRSSFLESVGLSPRLPTLALLPGSREAEVERLLQPMLEAYQQVKVHRPEIQALIPLAPSLSREWVEGLVGNIPEVALIDGQASEVLQVADVGVVASGTATVEAALAGLPIVIVYRLAPLTHFIGKLLVRGVPYFGMPNVILNRKVAPELLQEDAHPERIALEVERLLGNENVRIQMKKDFGEIRSLLKNPFDKSSSQHAAELVLSELERAHESV